MTVSTDEMTIVDLLEDLDDGLDHWVCVSCYPGYDPHGVVETLCGKLSEDCEPGTTWDDDGDECEKCNRCQYCPKCGYFQNK